MDQNLSFNPNNQDIQTGLQPADFDKAIIQRNALSNRYYKQQQVQWLAKLPHFKIYGVGIYLFFSFLKHAAILFAILSILSLVPIVFNVVKGSTLRNGANSLDIYLTKTSIGSYKFSLLNVSGAYDLSISYKVLNVSFDIIACALYLIFCFYWEKKSKNIAKHISKQIKLQSNYTIEVVQFPNDTKEYHMEQFMKKFGTITEVVAARDYTQQIEISQQIYELQLQVRQQQFEDKSKNEIYIKQINDKIKNLYFQLDLALTRSHQITRFYIQFQTPQQRKKILQKFQPYQKICSCCTQIPNQMLLDNQKLKIMACNTEPTGILWENAHFTWRMRLPRVLVQLLIVLSIIVGGFIFISFLNILVPPIQTDVDTSKMDYNRISVQTNKTIVQAWCIQNFQIKGAQSPYFTTCSYCWKLYVNSIIISISISIITMILCEVIKKIVYKLGYFQRYTTKTQQSVTVMTNLFIMQFLTTTLITFLMQANVFSLSILNFLRSLTSSPDLMNNINNKSQYKDLTSGWYKDIGYQIWLNILVQIFLPQVFQPFVLYIQQKFLEWRAKKQKIHINMVKMLQCPQFQIQDLYSNLLLIIATGFIFGGGIQLMMIIVFLCLIVRYFYLRFIFIRFCKVPINYNQILNQRLILILKVILIIRCLISLYMYGAEDVFAMEKSTFMKWALSLQVPVFSSIFIILSRIVHTWYYSIFVILFILLLIFKNFIFIGVKRFKKWRKSENHQDENNQTKTENKVQEQQNRNINKTAEQILKQDSIQSWASNQNKSVKSQRTVLKSYRLQKNPLYSQVLAIMKLKMQKSNQIFTQDHTKQLENKMNNLKKKQIHPQ